MPLPSAIAAHKTALARIIAGLFAMLGLTGQHAPQRIPKKLHSAITRTLRPAESAVRRLIVFLSRGMTAKPQPPRPLPGGLVRAPGPGAVPSFKLFDPRPRLIWLQRPPVTARPQPRISFFGDGEVRTVSLAPASKPAGDGLETSAHLLRRLQALKAALDDLPRQARRLVRAMARRKTSPRLQFKGPMRPGRPPGFRKRPLFEIDALLHQCDGLARECLPDTS